MPSAPRPPAVSRRATKPSSVYASLPPSTRCKSIAVWYLLRRSNADVLYDKARDYYTLAIEWLRAVAGVGTSGGSLAPDLPPIEDSSGQTQPPFKMGSNPKFHHHFD